MRQRLYPLLGQLRQPADRLGPLRVLRNAVPQRPEDLRERDLSERLQPGLWHRPVVLQRHLREYPDRPQ